MKLPTLELLLEAHRVEIRESGSPEGFKRDALEAALARPRQLLAYKPEASVFELAACLGFAVVKINHPFVDGNKRVAFHAINLVLGLNGWYLDAPERDATDIIKGVAAGDYTEQRLSDFLCEWSYQVE